MAIFFFKSKKSLCWICQPFFVTKLWKFAQKNKIGQDTLTHIFYLKMIWIKILLFYSHSFIHMPRFTSDGHHPFSYPLHMPLCENKMDLCLCPEGISWLTELLDQGAYGLHKWILFYLLMPYLSGIYLKAETRPTTLTHLNIYFLATNTLTL